MRDYTDGYALYMEYDWDRMQTTEYYYACIGVTDTAISCVQFRKTDTNDNESDYTFVSKYIDMTTGNRGPVVGGDD